MKVYVSGPITGVENYMERFCAAERKLLEMPLVDTVVNPAQITSHFPADTKWSQYMDVTIQCLRGCDAIYLLKGWEKSRGAQIEKLYAEGTGMKILFER